MHSIQGKQRKLPPPPARSSYFVETIIQGSDKKIKKEKTYTINISKAYSMVIFWCIATIYHVATLVQCKYNGEKKSWISVELAQPLYLHVSKI